MNFKLPNHEKVSPIILAIDTTDLEKVRELIGQTRSYISIYKFGLEFYLKFGNEVLHSLIDQFDIELFLDLKLHDIPNTVTGACNSISNLNPYFLTVHASGGAEMLKAAVQALPRSRIAAVTVLTSLDEKELKAMGIKSPISALVLAMAERSYQYGAKAIVCSPLEVAIVKKTYPSMITITPGIRSGDDLHADQLRTMSAKDAIASGSDFLVIGRPITSALNPAQAANDILKSIKKV